MIYNAVWFVYTSVTLLLILFHILFIHISMSYSLLQEHHFIPPSVHYDFYHYRTVPTLRSISLTTFILLTSFLLYPISDLPPPTWPSISITPHPSSSDHSLAPKIILIHYPTRSVLTILHVSSITTLSLPHTQQVQHNRYWQCIMTMLWWMRHNLFAELDATVSFTRHHKTVHNLGGGCFVTVLKHKSNLSHCIAETERK